jgi:hypothetical protein
MNAARQILADLARIGATIEPAGDRLILRAGNTAVPTAFVNCVRTTKADLIAALARLRDEEQEHSREWAGGQPKHSTFEARVVEWLNRHPAPSPPGRCAWCGVAESSSAVVRPFGTELHTWLHYECWAAWHQARRAEAMRR